MAGRYDDRLERDFFVELEDAKEVDSMEMAAVTKRLPARAMLTTADLAEALDVSASTVMGYVRSGELRALNIGTRDQPRYKMARESVMKFLKGRFS